ncbi:hypothetical protein HDU76_001737 [Blyttiomyces sp. JEL0837]|nr:hypothetical protein HDU76_001737 [Blyttiomyces sp. JEL0837]
MLGLRMETVRREPSTTPKRAVELAAYFSHCQLQPLHLEISLYQGMTVAYKNKNFETAIQFATRLLELGPGPERARKARGLIQMCERTPTNEHELDYNQHNPFVVCAMTYTPIYRGSKAITCPLCQASYKPEYEGKTCTVCEVAAIGVQASGLRNLYDAR